MRKIYIKKKNYKQMKIQKQKKKRNKYNLQKFI